MAAPASPGSVLEEEEDKEEVVVVVEDKEEEEVVEDKEEEEEAVGGGEVVREVEVQEEEDLKGVSLVAGEVVAAAGDATCAPSPGEPGQTMPACGGFKRTNAHPTWSPGSGGS